VKYIHLYILLLWSYIVYSWRIVKVVDMDIPAVKAFGW